MKEAESVEVTVTESGEALALTDTTEIQETPPEDSDMAKRKTSRARKGKSERTTRPKFGRLSKESVFVFKGTPDGFEKKIPPRGRAFLNALEKIERGTSDQVAAKVTKGDYSGKQDIKFLSRYFLRKLVNVGAVSVDKSTEADA